MILHHTIAGSGAPVVLLHPVGIESVFLAPLATLLAQHHQVISLDLRGHGQSALEPADSKPASSLEDYADDVHATLEHGGFAPAAVVGFSFGGMVAQTLALRHPQDVSALLPCACPGSLDPERSRISLARGTDALRDGMAAVLEATMARWFTPAFRQSGAAAPAQDYLLNRDPRGWAQGWHAISKLDLLDQLPRLRIPALCIAGELDLSSPPSTVGRIAAAIPGASLKIIPGAPHMLCIEQPQAVASAILEFLQSLPQLK